MRWFKRKLYRKFRFYGSRCWCKQFLRPRTLLHHAHIHLYAKLFGTKRDGLYFVVPRDDSDPEIKDFTATVTTALDLVAQYDPRRYRTLVRHVKAIYWEDILRSDAAYHRLFRTCYIDYQRIIRKFAALDVTTVALHKTVYLASLLVHEATHGRIESFFVPYDKVNRDAIERLCVKEQERFVKRLYLQGVYPKVEFYPFCAGNWKELWSND